MADDSRDIPLSQPIEHDGRQITSFSMRIPWVRDLRDSEKGGGSDADKEIRLFANLCMVAPDVVLDLPVADYRALQRATGI